MPLSYKVIKNHQVNVTNKDFKIPTTTAKDFQEPRDRKTSRDIKDQEIKKEADRQIQSAKEQAKIILREANKKAEDIQSKAQTNGYNQGFKQGQEKGYETGYAKALEDTQKLKDQAKSLLHNAHKESRGYIRKTKEEIIDLSIGIARAIIHYSIDKKDKNITGIVKNALEKAEASKQIILRCRPEYIEVLKNNVDEFLKICPNSSFVFLEDKQVEDGSCIIETDTQSINLQIDGQLENIKTSLLEMREEDGL